MDFLYLQALIVSLLLFVPSLLSLSLSKDEVGFFFLGIANIADVFLVAAVVKRGVVLKVVVFFVVVVVGVVFGARVVKIWLLGILN